ncbi:ATP-binding protein [Nocardiopsis oceani]
MEDYDDGYLVKVIFVIGDGKGYLGRTSSGGIVRFSAGSQANLGAGDVIFVSHSNRWEVLPDAAWPEIPELAVVRRLLDDGVVVEVGASMRLLLGEASVDVKVGNTVVFDDTDGITRVISETPIRFRDVGFDEDDLNGFLVDSNDSDKSQTFENSFGGYREVRERAKELIETQFVRRGDLKKIGVRPVKGVIFTGPPGTGKTHLARIIANESNATLFLVSGPSIVSKWVGDSEDTLRRIFEAANKENKALIFFDEIDSIAEKRSSESNEASKRLVAQLLTLLDGFDEESGNVVVIAATNRIGDVDEALLRPGRFDWEISFNLPTLRDRCEILRVGAYRLETEGYLPIEEVAYLTEGWSAARLSSIWTEAGLVAAGDGRKAVSEEDLVLAFERVRTRPDRNGNSTTEGESEN